MKTKQHFTKKPMGQQWNQRRNQKIPWGKKNETTTLQNLWDAAKAVVREEFIVIQVYLKK